MILAWIWLGVCDYMYGYSHMYIYILYNYKVLYVDVYTVHTFDKWSKCLNFKYSNIYPILETLCLTFFILQYVLSFFFCFFLFFFIYYYYLFFIFIFIFFPLGGGVGWGGVGWVGVGRGGEGWNFFSWFSCVYILLLLWKFNKQIKKKKKKKKNDKSTYQNY